MRGSFDVDHLGVSQQAIQDDCGDYGIADYLLTVCEVFIGGDDRGVNPAGGIVFLVGEPKPANANLR